MAVARIIDEGPGGEVLLTVDVVPFVRESVQGGLVLTEFPEAIRIDELEGLLYYQIPYDATVYGNLNSSARVGRRG